jgi:hypothetical protein
MYEYFFQKYILWILDGCVVKKVNLFFNIEFWYCGGHSVLGKATTGRSSTRYLLTRDSFPPSPTTRDSFPGPGRPGSFRRTVDRSSCAGLRVSWRFARARSLARSIPALPLLPVAVVALSLVSGDCVLFSYSHSVCGVSRLWKPRLYFLWLCTCCYCSVFHWVRVVGVVVLTFLLVGRPAFRVSLPSLFVIRLLPLVFKYSVVICGEQE